MSSKGSIRKGRNGLPTTIGGDRSDSREAKTRAETEKKYQSIHDKITPWWWLNKPKKPPIPKEMLDDPVGWFLGVAQKHGIILDGTAVSAIRAALHGMIPYIVGKPGVGKSAMVNAIYTVLVLGMGEKHVDQQTLDLSGLMPYEVTGGRKPSEYGLINIPPATFYPAWDGKVLVLNLAELGASGPAQYPAREMLSSRGVPDAPFPPHLIIMATGNPAEMNAGQGLTPPMINRMMVLDYMPDPGTWPSFFVEYWGMEDYEINKMFIPLPKERWRMARNFVAAFVMSNPSMITDIPDAQSEEPFPSPRSLDYVSRILASHGLTARDDIQKEWSHIEPEIVGLIGSSAAKILHTWIVKNALNIDPGEILRTGKIPKGVNRVDNAFLLLGSIVSYIRGMQGKEKKTNVVKGAQILLEVISKIPARDPFTSHARFFWDELIKTRNTGLANKIASAFSGTIMLRSNVERAMMHKP